MTLKEKKVYNFVLLKINPTFNNIFLTLTDFQGNVLLTKHAGLLKFKGSKKRTPYVAAQVMKQLISDLDNLNLEIKTIIIQVFGYIRHSSIQSIIRYLDKLALKNVIYVEYINKKAHNGLRLKKKRRL